MATGNIGFFEIQVDDFQRAQKFYHDVFGWQFSKSGGVPYEFYMIDTIKQGEVGNQEGGMRQREKPLTSAGFQPNAEEGACRLQEELVVD